MKPKKQGARLRALKAAFPHTIPIFSGYLFLGMTYGVYMVQSGFPFWIPMLTTLIVYGGSLEFVIVNLLLGAFNPIQAFLMALLIQARHLFYGVSMLDKYRDVGRKKPYLIFALSDETFSVTCSTDVPEDVDRGWFYFFVTLLDQLYWFCGAALGMTFFHADVNMREAQRELCAMAGYAPEGEMELAAALLSGDETTFKLFRTQAPELVHLPDATYEWYCKNYLDRYYPVRFILHHQGIEFPQA